MDKLMIFDGSFEDELRKHLNTIEELPEDFAIKALEFKRFAVYKTHLAYLRAGAQIIRTNTYRVRTNFIKSRLDLPPIIYVPLINVAVKLAKQAVITYYEETANKYTYEDYDRYHEHRPLIAGSCGSCHVSWNLDPSKDEETLIMTLIDFHKQRVQKLLEAGVDLLTFESIPSKIEANAITRVLARFPDARVWINFLCSESGKLVDGNKFAKIATKFYESMSSQVIAIGAEGVSRGTMIRLIQEVNIKDIKIPFVLYAEECHMPTINEIPITLQYNFVEDWTSKGVRYIGGGTHTFANDIMELRNQMNRYRASTNMVFTSLKARVCSYQAKDNQSKL
ncbi:PREDICTED: homocysteine S-methyltransferase YbgG-like [Dinoponera quadriceps]|uniref:Homocysteine S-methyltransferase YbgG-like n=1 Tax=Dinoponera quadriceps TaxID=609295 RepID=A0A6P3WY26_DINQU|nr:PREDICTED: homocysteine S-methyltransferase YbgG-like [Dinoponera quadriceps]